MPVAPKDSVPESNIEWRLFGELDVGASHDDCSGIAEWQILRSHLNQYGLPKCDACCEIGCGAGRLTKAIADNFQTVHALDISKDRLSSIEGACRSRNCVTHLVEEPAIPLPDASCDLLVSVHVFQHIANGAAITCYLHEAHRVLRPGGVLLLHLPVVGAHGFTGDLPETLARKSKAAAKWLVLVLMRQLVRAGFPRSPAVSTYKLFSFARVSRQLLEIGFSRIEMRVLPVRDYHAYIFASKS